MMHQILRSSCIAAFLVATIGLTFGCSSNPGAKPEWVEASGSNLPAVRTFGWHGGESPPAAIIDNQIRDAIRAELISKGYVETADSPDMLIDHETIEQAAIEQGNPVRLGIGIGSWGGNVGGSVGTSVDVGDKEHIIQQLRILVRAMDPDSDSEMWLGRTAALSDQPTADAVAQALARLLAAFPTKKSDG